MLKLRLPTMKQLNKVSVSDAFQWLSSIETELKRSLELLPNDYAHDRRKIEASLARLEKRREEYRQSFTPPLMAPK